MINITAMIMISCGVASAERLSVTSPVANIRSGPGTGYDILWKVEKYFPVYVFEKSGSWYHFRDFENDKGWLHKSLVGKMKSIITVKQKCNVRSGAGTNYKILFVVEKGIPFLVLNKKGSWLHVRHGDGDEGWLHKSLVW